MDDAFVFYAYWNGNQIRDLFEGLVGSPPGRALYSWRLFWW